MELKDLGNGNITRQDEIGEDLRVKMFTLGKIATRCYLVQSEGEAVLIDCADISPQLYEYIDSSGLKVKYMLLTHGHADHTAGVFDFCSRYRVPAVIGCEEEAIISDVSFCGALMLSMPMPKFPCDMIYVSQGDEISFGRVKLKVLETPGHTVGSVSYYTQGLIFCGDTLFRGGYGRTDMASGSEAELFASIKNKLFALPAETIVLPGHGGRSTIEREKAFYD